jgi:hypothetical protein
VECSGCRRTEDPDGRWWSARVVPLKDVFALDEMLLDVLACLISTLELALAVEDGDSAELEARR